MLRTEQQCYKEKFQPGDGRVFVCARPVCVEIRMALVPVSTPARVDLPSDERNLKLTNAFETDPK